MECRREGWNRRSAGTGRQGFTGETSPPCVPSQASCALPPGRRPAGGRSPRVSGSGVAVRVRDGVLLTPPSADLRPRGLKWAQRAFDGFVPKCLIQFPHLSSTPAVCRAGRRGGGACEEERGVPQPSCCPPAVRAKQVPSWNSFVKTRCCFRG